MASQSRNLNATNLTELAPALGLTGVIILMVLPVPAFLMDFSLVMSIALSLTILIVSLYVKEALEFSAFPSVLLFATLFRRALYFGCHAGKANGHRRRFERRPYQRSRSAPAAPAHSKGRRLLRCHGRCFQIRARRCGGGFDYPGGQFTGRVFCRRDAKGHGLCR